MKKLPLGISDFDELIAGGYYYIDKTMFIDELERLSGKILLISRPRRFGKTLNLSMVRYFYEHNVESKAALFHGTALWRHTDYHQLQGTLPVIFLSLRDAKKKIWEMGYKHIVTAIATEFERHASVLLPTLADYEAQKYRALVNGSASSAFYAHSLLFLSTLLARHYKKRALVLIDEYDSPIHAAYSNGYYDEALDFIRSLLSSVLKDNPAVERGILTGILRAGKEGIFSGLNNVLSYTVIDDEFSDKFGFTPSEVDQLLHDAALTDKKEQIKEWYNGYTCGSTILYNPWSMLECCKKGGVLKPYWVNTSDNELIKKIIPRTDDETKYDLEKLLRGGSVEKNVNDALVFPGIEKDSSAVWSLLLFTGYLTFTSCQIKEGSTLCLLTLPNREVKILYRNLITSLLTDSFNGANLDLFMEALQMGKVDLVMQMLDNFIVSSLSSFDLTSHEPEKSYHLFMLGLFVVLHKQYEVTSNRESGYGRYDIMLIPHDTTQPGMVIEFKKVSSVLGETLETASKKALDQIEEKRYVHELFKRGIKKVQAYGIAFLGKKLAIKHQEYPIKE